MTENNKSETKIVLYKWRTRILNVVLIIMAAIAAPALAIIIAKAVSTPNLVIFAITLSALELFLIALAVFRRIDLHIRVGCLIVIGYAAAIISMNMDGLSGAGPLYLIVLPVITLILVGKRSGIIATIISGLLGIIFAALIGLGKVPATSASITPWMQLASFIMLLSMVAILLILFYRFQEQVIEKERSSHAKLIQAQSLLKKQNMTLEQRIKDRTAELTESNKIQTALFKIADAASVSHDMQEFYTNIHRTVGELMYARNFFIALYDEATDILGFPYYVDEKDQPAAPQPLENFHGVTSYVIRTGMKIKHGRKQFNQLIKTGIIKLEGTLPEDAIGVPLISEGKILGAIFLQSYTEGIHYAEKDDEILAYVAQHIATALARVRALEAEHERNNELAILNSVGEAITKTLDVKTVTRIVGDKLREIFTADGVLIMLLDKQTNLIHSYYEYDENEGGYIDYVEPFPVGKGLASKVILTKQPLMAGTLEEEIAAGAYFPPEIIEKGSGFYSQSWLGVPIIANEEVLGLIALADGDAHAFNENHLRLMHTLSSNVGVAIANAGLFQAEAQRASELAIINSVQAGLASQLDMQGIFELVGEKIQEIFDANTVTLATFDLEKNIMYRHFTVEEEKRFEIKPAPISGIWRYFIEQGQPALINNDLVGFLNRIDPNFKIPVGKVPKCALSVPLRIQGEIRGVISLQNVERENAFTQSDLRLLETLSNSLSVALENARLFEETERLLKETGQRATELQIINNVQQALASKLDMAAIYELIGDKIREIFHDTDMAIRIHDPATNLVFWPYVTENGKRLEIKPHPLPDSGFVAQVLRTRETLIINDHMAEAIHKFGSFLPAGFDETISEKSAIHVPLLMGKQARGVITLADLQKENAFSTADVRLLETLANSLSVALENARLFEETQRLLQQTEQRAAELATVNTVSSALTKELDLEALIKLVGEQTRNLFQSDIAYVALLDETNNQIVFPYTHGEEFTPLPIGEGLTSRVIQTNQSLLINRDMDREVVHSKVIGKQARSYLGVPIIVSGKAVGVLSVQSTTQQGMFTEDDARLLSTIATGVGAALHNAQLFSDVQKSRADAEKANAAKSAFLANMSHELRTPLNAIIGFTRIVRRKGEDILPEKQTENLDKVLVSAEHLLNLINTVLDIAKIEAGRMDVMAANFRIGALVDLCANTAQPLIRPGVVLEKKVDENLNQVFSDQDKIRQIMLNLLSNAAKFTHEGWIQLVANQEEEKLKISVIDTGIGISEEALPRIFKEFQQADNSTTRQYGGTGLGLSISRNLARLLGGDLTVKSELGKGSTFSLVIPLQYRGKVTPSMETAVQTISERSGISGDKSPTTSAQQGKKRVLVIDDDPDAAYLLQENLNQQEFEIIGARSGHEGLQKARQEHPNAILLDILMPETDGWQILHDLKEDPETTGIPVILLTIVDKKALGFRLGAAAYLLKPLDPVAVKDALDRVIGVTKGQQRLILVVDDDPSIADMLHQFLPEEEFRLESALDGIAALKAIEANRPDIILLDIIMPRLDGFGVIERLRSDPKTRELPIIVISAKELTNAETNRLKKTVAMVMKKQGFEGEKLLDEIHHVLNETQTDKSLNS